MASKFLVTIMAFILFAIGILTWDYWLDHNNIGFGVNAMLFIVATVTITMPVMSYWETKFRKLFNIED